MWQFLKDLFLIRNRSIGRDMVISDPSDKNVNTQPGSITLHRLRKRKLRRKLLKARQTTRLKQARYR